MLEELLAEIRSEKTLKPAVLAGRLNTSVAMVQAMIEDLERLGLLQPVDLSCSEPCGGCSLVDSCTTRVSEKSRLWRLSR